MELPELAAKAGSCPRVGRGHTPCLSTRERTQCPPSRRSSQRPREERRADKAKHHCGDPAEPHDGDARLRLVAADVAEQLASNIPLVEPRATSLSSPATRARSLLPGACTPGGHLLPRPSALAPIGESESGSPRVRRHVPPMAGDGVACRPTRHDATCWPHVGQPYVPPPRMGMALSRAAREGSAVVVCVAAVEGRRS